MQPTRIETDRGSDFEGAETYTAGGGVIVAMGLRDGPPLIGPGDVRIKLTAAGARALAAALIEAAAELEA